MWEFLCVHTYIHSNTHTEWRRGRKGRRDKENNRSGLVTFRRRRVVDNGGSFLLVKEDVVSTPVRTPFQSLDTYIGVVPKIQTISIKVSSSSTWDTSPL